MICPQGYSEDTPEILRMEKTNLTRNASVIPDNWELTRTPSGSDESELIEHYVRPAVYGIEDPPEGN